MTTQDLAAFARIEAAASPSASADLVGIDPAALCQSYHGVEADIRALLPMVALIPGYGPAISAALTMLMKIADALCPTQNG